MFKKNDDRVGALDETVRNDSYPFSHRPCINAHRSMGAESIVLKAAERAFKLI